MSKKIYVIGENKGGELLKATRECLSEARKLGGEVTCLLFGSSAGTLAAAAGQQGADAVVTFGDAAFDKWSLEAVADAVTPVLQDADLVIIPATTHGKELAGKLAARFKAALASEVISLSLEGDTFKAVRPMYAGKVRATVAMQGKPAFATLRPNVVDVTAPDAGKTANVTAGTATVGAGKVELTGVETKADSGTVDLSEARVVVSGGRGLKGPENFHLIDSLAAAVTGAVGASRMVVDAGWKEHRYQVGQTGRVVTPELYIAVGISGAIQHLVGMQNSGCIVAINNNPDAPIFKIADYGVVADLFEFVPVLTEELKGVKVAH